MPIDAVNALVQQLCRHPLLEPAPLEELTRSLQHRCKDARLLGRELIQRGWLTPFQVNQLLMGRGAELIFGAYVLLERLGEAPAGELFKARHQRMRRHCALLVVRSELLAQPEAVQRFYQEVQAVSQLSHRHLVTAYDAGPIGASHFLAMEFVEGDHLQTVVDQAGPLPLPLACNYAYQAALGLQHAWERGLLHHDLRPENLLLTKPRPAATGLGLIKVANLGLTILYQNPRLVRDGGTAAAALDYLPPERAPGQPENVRSELYSLGCTLHFLLTRQPPFPGGTPADKARRHREETPAPLRTLRPDAPDALQSLVRILLAKNPDERCQTPAAAAEVLAGIPGLIDYRTDWGTSAGSTEIALPRPTHIGLFLGQGLLRRWWPYLLAAGLLLAGGLVLGTALLLSAFSRPETARSGPADTKPVVVVQRPPQPGTAQLIVECGRVKNAQELERAQPGFTYRRIQGEPYAGWPPARLKSHCWAHGRQIQFEIIVPPGTGGFLRLFCYDADSVQRKQRVRVAQSNFSEEFANFGGAGKTIELHLTAQQLQGGKIEVTIDNLGPHNAVISTVEFLTYRR